MDVRDALPPSARDSDAAAFLVDAGVGLSGGKAFGVAGTRIWGRISGYLPKHRDDGYQAFRHSCSFKVRFSYLCRHGLRAHEPRVPARHAQSRTAAHRRSALKSVNGKQPMATAPEARLGSFAMYRASE
eukprot:6197151-Pleurochrysis_carterae.AAC.1